MDITTKLESLYTPYLDEADTLKRGGNKSASLFKRIFGIKHNPGDKDLNPNFYYAVTACLEEFQSEPYTPEDALAVVEYVLHAAASNTDNPIASFALIQVQGLLTPLVSSLPPEKAANLADWYKKQYPYRNRFPVQENLLKALKTCSKK
jgi:hypothetical protein